MRIFRKQSSKWVEAMPMIQENDLDKYGLKIRIDNNNAVVPPQVWNNIHQLSEEYLQGDGPERWDIEERVQKIIGTTPQVSFYLVKDESIRKSFIMNPDDSKILGKVIIRQCDVNAWYVSYAVVKRGFGPTLYDKAMEYVSNLGGSLIPHSEAGRKYPYLPNSRGTNTPDSQKVWDFYEEKRDDVEKSPEGFRFKSPDEEEIPA